MKRLTHTELTALIERVEQTSADGDTPAWRDLHAELSARDALLSLPLGELANPEIAGFLWLLRGRDLVWRLDDGAGVEKQGMEPVTDLRASLLDAVLLTMAAGPRRIAVSAPPARPVRADEGRATCFG